jgi:hypothetical protein
MLRRRPAAVYELLAEDELLERGEPAGGDDRHSGDGGLRGHGHEPVTVAGASTVGAPRATARRTLLVALTAAALVGFAVWELLGIASESSASRPGVALQGLRSDVGQQRQPGRPGSAAPSRAQGWRPATRSLHPRRPAAAASRTSGVTPAALLAIGSTPAIQPGRPPMPAAPIPPVPAPSMPSAEREFGFER